MPRIVEVEAFPQEHRAAVRAAAAAMSANGRDPAHYAATVSQAPSGLLEVYARHDSHPTAQSERGDLCGRCCVVRYNPNTGAVSRVFGIR